VDLEAPLAGQFLNGQAVRSAGLRPGPARVYRGDALLGVGEGNSAGELQPTRLIASG